MSAIRNRSQCLVWGLRLGAAACVLAMMAPVATAQYFGRNKIQYEQFDWHVLETEHFDIYYYPEMQTLAEHGAHFAEEAYEELEHRFDFSLTHRVPLIFYSSNLHFKQTNVTPGFIPDGVGGFFEFLKGRVVVPANGDLHRFRRVIRHETVHVFTYSKFTRVLRDHGKPVDRLFPLWFTEGLAEYWSGEPDYQHEMIMRDAMASNFFVPLENLNHIYGTYVMYKEGEALCRFISEVYGEEKILQLIENAWRDRNFNEVMEFVLREDFRDISDRWTRWLREQYLPMLEDADVPTLIADAVASRGFNMKPVVHERPDGSREVVYVASIGGYTSVYAMPIDADYQPSGEPEVLVRGGRSQDFEAFHLFESRMDVSEDGLLAFVTQRGERDVIHVYDLRARERVGLYDFDNLVAVYSPTWSPGSRQLAFTGIDKGGWADLYTYDRNGEALRRLTRDTYDDRDPDWSPDGSRIVFSSDRTAAGENGAYNLFTFDFGTASINYVTYGEHMDLSPRWSPDGSQIVFVSARRQPDGKFSAQDLWVADMSGEGVEEILSMGEREDGGVGVSEDASLMDGANESMGKREDGSVGVSTDERLTDGMGGREDGRMGVPENESLSDGVGEGEAGSVGMRESSGSEEGHALSSQTPERPTAHTENEGVGARVNAGPAERATSPAQTPTLPPAQSEEGASELKNIQHSPPHPLTPSYTHTATTPRPTYRLTAFTSASFDPVWTSDDRLVFASFEDFRFTIRQMEIDSLIANPRQTMLSRVPLDREPWAFERHVVADSTQRFRYRRRYQLDIAQGSVSTNPVFGTGGGASVLFSDVMGNDIWHVTAYSNNTLGRSFLESLNIGITRIHLGRRANYGYGIFRLAGQRYDRTDPDAPAGFPVYYEQVYGGVGLVSYPVSKFRRVEINTSMGWSRKDQFFDEVDLESVLLSNSATLVHDNTLYGLNGPVDGWRANLTVGYTTDVLNSNVSYYTVSADVRRYFRIVPGVTLASWGNVRANVGRRARLHLIGGSWNLRGYPFFRLRGKHLWFTSHELRFPLAIAPSAWIPVLEPFGIANLRGALFVDAAHLWNEGYNDVEFDPGSGFEIGRTLGSVGGGLRMNIYGGIVLRYDIGYRFPTGFNWDERQTFNQFFFGWDF